ncbi:MAG: WG repeat-containing protein [Chitinophagaceae bacterium]
MKHYHKLAVLIAIVFNCHLLFSQSCLNYVPYNQKGLWGYADTAGNIVVKPFSANELGFFDDSDYVKYYSANGMEGLMDKNFKSILPPRFMSLEVLDKKLVVAQVYKEAFKIFSFKGKQLSTLMFVQTSFVSGKEGYLLVRSSSGTAFLYTYNEKLDRLDLKRKHIGTTYAYIGNNETYTLHYRAFPYVEHFHLNDGAKYEDMDAQDNGRLNYDSEGLSTFDVQIKSKKVSGEVLSPDIKFDCSKTDYENNSLLHVKINGKWGVIDQERHILVPVNVDTILQTYNYTSLASLYSWPISEHALGWLCKKDGLYGVVSNNDSFNVPFIYSKLSYYGKGYLIAKLNGKYGLLSHDAKVVIPFEIDSFYTNHWKPWSYINGGILLYAINQNKQLAMYCTNGQKTGYDFTSFDYMRNTQGGDAGVRLYNGKLYGAVMHTSYGIYYYPCAFKKVYFARIHLGCDYLKVLRPNNQYGYINNTGRKFYED